jgi:hypothetical protein
MKKLLLLSISVILLLSSCSNENKQEAPTSPISTDSPKTEETFVDRVNKEKKESKTEPDIPTNAKKMIATYIRSENAGDWSGLYFKDENNKEISFMNKNDHGSLIKELWSTKPTGEDPDDVTIEYHTIKSKVGKKYKIIYIEKNIKHQGFDIEGAHNSKENVILSLTEEM